MNIWTDTEATVELTRSALSRSISAVCVRPKSRRLQRRAQMAKNVPAARRGLTPAPVCGARVPPARAGTTCADPLQRGREARAPQTTDRQR